MRKILSGLILLNSLVVLYYLGTVLARLDAIDFKQICNAVDSFVRILTGNS